LSGKYSFFKRFINRDAPFMEKGYKWYAIKKDDARKMLQVDWSDFQRLSRDCTLGILRKSKPILDGGVIEERGDGTPQGHLVDVFVETMNPLSQDEVLAKFEGTLPGADQELKGVFLGKVRDTLAAFQEEIVAAEIPTGEAFDKLPFHARRAHTATMLHYASTMSVYIGRLLRFSGTFNEELLIYPVEALTGIPGVALRPALPYAKIYARKIVRKLRRRALGRWPYIW